MGLARWVRNASRTSAALEGILETGVSSNEMTLEDAMIELRENLSFN